MAAGPILDGQKWHSDRNNMIIEEFDDTYLVYFKPSGETHFLNFLSHGLIECVLDQAFDANTLQTMLCSKFDFEASELPLDLVLKTIEDLDEAGLVTPEPIVGKDQTHE
jgi:PqqD family protein of HPr-rel-A system